MKVLMQTTGAVIPPLQSEASMPGWCECQRESSACVSRVTIESEGNERASSNTILGVGARVWCLQFTAPAPPASSLLHLTHLYFPPSTLVANLGRLLFVASRAAFQLAPILVLVLPVLLLSHCFPLSQRSSLFVHPLRALPRSRLLHLCHLHRLRLCRALPHLSYSFAHGLPLHPRCKGSHGAAHLSYYVTLTLRSVDFWMAAAPL